MAEQDDSTTQENNALEEFEHELGAIHAQVDVLGMLSATGDVESLKEHVLSTSLLDIGARLTDLGQRFGALRGRLVVPHG